jgi:hypothetical protein
MYSLTAASMPLIAFGASGRLHSCDLSCSAQMSGRIKPDATLVAAQYSSAIAASKSDTHNVIRIVRVGKGRR